MKHTSLFAFPPKIYRFIFLTLTAFIFNCQLAYATSGRLVYFTKGWFNYSTSQSLVSNDARKVFVTPDGSHIYVATASGLSVSLNGGIDWKNYSPSAQGSSPSIINSVYASTSGQYIYLGTNQGLALSTDAGAHWVYLPLGASHNVTDIVGNLDGGSAYVATDNGLFITTNFGRTWTRMAVTILCNAINSVYVTNNGQQIYAATNTGLFVSRDTGRTWNLVTVAVIANSIYASTDGRQLYLGTAIGLYISQDSGRTWTLITPQQGLADFNVQAVYVSNNNQTIYAATKKGLSVSSDQGKTWTTYTSTEGLGSSTVNDVYVSDNGLKIYAATSAGLSTKGLNLWHTVNNINNVDGGALFVSTDGQRIYTSTTTGLAISTNGGGYWNNYSQATPITTISVNSTGSHIYVSSFIRTGPGIWLSTDSGTSWGSIPASPDSFINAVAANEDSTQIYAALAAGSQLYSTTGGRSWFNAPYGRGAHGECPHSAGCPAPRGGPLLISTNGQQHLSVVDYNLYISKDSGQSWTLSSVCNKSSDLFYTYSVVSIYGSENPQRVYVGCKGTDAGDGAGLFASQDGSNTWTQYGPTGSPNYAPNSIFTSTDGTQLYLATNSGVYVSQDSGAHWTNYTTANGLPSNTISQIRGTADGKQLYATAIVG